MATNTIESRYFKNWPLRFLEESVNNLCLKGFLTASYLEWPNAMSSKTDDIKANRSPDFLIK